MYLRTIKRKNKDGSVVEYVQLAHNVRHPDKGYPKAEVIHSFGRREQLDIDGLKRLVTSIGRFIELDDPSAKPIEGPGASSITFIRSHAVGGIYLLHALWDRLQIADCLQAVAKPHSFPISCQHTLFAEVARCALAPFSVGAPFPQLLSEDIFTGQGSPSGGGHLDQTLEFLEDHTDAIRQEISQAVVSHLNVDIDLVFMLLIPAGRLHHGHQSSNRRGSGGVRHQQDLPPSGIIGLAVSKRGIPLKWWWMPGSKISPADIEAVQTDLARWTPGRIIWVMDRLVTGDENQAVLMQCGIPYILGEKLAGGGAGQETEKAKGRFKMLGPDLQIKASIVQNGDRCRKCAIAYHPRQAEIDRNARARTLRRLQHELEQWGEKKAEDSLANTSLVHARQRYVKMLSNEMPKIDATRVKQEEKRDGKYLLIANDEGLLAETLAFGHKHLLDMDQAFRGISASLVGEVWDVSAAGSPCAVILLLWLTLLITRMAEIQTGMVWPNLCREMQGLQLGEFVDGNRRILQYTELTSQQKKILEQLHIMLPHV